MASLKALVARTPEQMSHYAGDAACALCHSQVFEKWSASGHAHALRVVTDRSDGELFRDPQVIRDEASNITYRVGVQNGRCVMLIHQPDEDTVQPAELAMGSGHNGVTYLGRDSLDRWIVLRISHYTLTRHWDFSPKQTPEQHASLDPGGDIMGSNTSLASCLSCHVTTLRMNDHGPDLKGSRLGVGCERCHGPGKEHVDSISAPRSGKPRVLVPMAKLGSVSPTAILELCDTCHSTPAAPESFTRNAHPDLARFQSTAFVQSRCYKESGTFSCTTCHDPHKDASKDDASYERACLSCHSPSQAAAHQAEVCKVNPRNDCISCHMPASIDPAAPNTVVHNHWIAVWK